MLGSKLTEPEIKIGGQNEHRLKVREAVPFGPDLKIGLSLLAGHAQRREGFLGRKSFHELDLEREQVFELPGEASQQSDPLGFLSPQNLLEDLQGLGKFTRRDLFKEREDVFFLGMDQVGFQILKREVGALFEESEKFLGFQTDLIGAVVDHFQEEVRRFRRQPQPDLLEMMKNPPLLLAFEHLPEDFCLVLGIARAKESTLVSSLRSTRVDSAEGCLT